MCVVDDEDAGAVAADRLEQRPRDAVEEACLRSRAVERRSRRSAELGQEPRRLGGRTRRHRGRVAVAKDAPHELDRAAVREAGLLLDAADGRRRRPLRARPGDELVGEAGLADPGLAFEDDEPPVGPDGSVEIEQCAPLPLAPDERERRPGGPAHGHGRRGRGARNSFAYSVVGGGGLLGRRDAELAMQRADALAVLRERSGPLAARPVELDQAPMGCLVQRLERQPAPGVLDRAHVAPARTEPFGETIEHRPQLARERSRLQRLPVVERRAVAEPEAGEEDVALQRRGLLELREVSPTREPPELVDVEQDAVPLERDRIARDGEPASAERRAQRRKRPPQRRARAVGCVLGPQELGEHVAAVAALLDREVGEQRGRLARVDGQRNAVAERLRRAEERQPQRRVAHESDRRRNGAHGIALRRNDFGTVVP